MRYTLRELEYFVATCEAGSVTEAAHAIPVVRTLVATRPTRLVSSFVEHCRRLVAESGVPGLQGDG